MACSVPGWSSGWVVLSREGRICVSPAFPLGHGGCPDFSRASSALQAACRACGSLQCARALVFALSCGSSCRSYRRASSRIMPPEPVVRSAIAACRAPDGPLPRRRQTARPRPLPDASRSAAPSSAPAGCGPICRAAHQASDGPPSADAMGEPVHCIACRAPCRLPHAR